MERKIGEIFEYNGEWYQCVEGLYCDNCAFVNDNCEDRERITLREKLTKQPTTGFCNSEKRNDRKSVIFKKLEKVGEPMKIHDRLVLKVKADAYKCMRCCFYSKAKCELTMQECKHYDCGEGTKFIEIKQTNEDMEDNRTINQHFAECGETINDVVRKCYTENKSTQIKDMEEYKMHDAKEDISEFDNIIGECLYDKQELKLKPFDLEAAKAGKPVCTRDGRKARIICFDKKKDIYPLIALVTDKDGYEIITPYKADGVHPTIPNDDLMMLTEKRSGWVNVYYDNDASSHRGCRYIYDTKERAVKEAGSAYIDTIKISWSE